MRSIFVHVNFCAIHLRQTWQKSRGRRSNALAVTKLLRSNVLMRLFDRGNKKSCMSASLSPSSCLTNSFLMHFGGRRRTRQKNTCPDDQSTVVNFIYEIHLLVDCVFAGVALLPTLGHHGVRCRGHRLR